MRTLLAAVLVIATACGGGNNTGDDQPTFQCSDGVDNDGDGLIDFPDDLGCVSSDDDSEDSLTSAKCQDGRDNDGDGLKDYPADPGCFAPQADDETDDCPSGPSCPQCADGIDNDGNGSTDYPNDPGCTAAADDEEFLHNPIACGSGMMIMPLPPTGMATGMLDNSSTSMVMSPCGGGGGAPAVAFELHLATPRVVEVSTDDAVTTADTVIDIRSDMCSEAGSHLACNDDISTSNGRSFLTKALPAGNYYIIIGARDSGGGGAFAMQVKTYSGTGTACGGDGDCGPGLVCRIPLGGSAMVCSLPMCSDGVDDDGAGDGADYPDDPGCTSPDDNDESDTCAMGPGPGCPECGDGIDNDGDLTTDFPADITCKAKGDASEACITSEGVTQIIGPMTMGTTAMSTDDVRPACASSFSHTAADRTFRLDVPALTSIDLNLTASFDSVTALYNSTCAGTAIKCSDPLTMNVLNLAAGTYYFVVDGYSTGNGPFTITTTGKIAPGASCEGTLALAGSLTCGAGYACKGTVGSRVCGPALCNDGVDNDSDGKIDYPNDPGCDSPADDTEGDTCPGGVGCPVCGNGMDDDTDSLTDYPADYGCSAASGTSEVFCAAEVDPTSLLTTTPVTGTTAGLAHNLVPTCRMTSTAPDKVYALSLPVPVQTLVINTDGSAIDTVLHIQDAACGMSLACDDDGGMGLQSQVTMTNVAAGNYAVVIDGYSTNAGAYILNVKGTVALGTACTSPLFTGGAAAILTCPTGSACTAGTCQ